MSIGLSMPVQPCLSADPRQGTTAPWYPRGSVCPLQKWPSHAYLICLYVMAFIIPVFSLQTSLPLAGYVKQTTTNSFSIGINKIVYTIKHALNFFKFEFEWKKDFNIFLPRRQLSMTSVDLVYNSKKATFFLYRPFWQSLSGVREPNNSRFTQPKDTAQSDPTDSMKKKVGTGMNDHLEKQSLLSGT